MLTLHREHKMQPSNWYIKLKWTHPVQSLLYQMSLTVPNAAATHQGPVYRLHISSIITNALIDRPSLGSISTKYIILEMFFVANFLA